jgi:hypothetical protein
MKIVSVIMLAAVGLSLQAMAASSESTLNGDGSSIANSLAPSGFFNADSANDASYLVALAPGLSDDSVVASGTVQMNGNPMQDFSAIAASSTDYNNNIGADTIKILPEPTTLALTTLGGLSALVFTRHFRKSRRA